MYKKLWFAWNFWRSKHIKCYPIKRNKFLSYQTDFTICVKTNSKHKSQGCVRFSRKSYAMTAKIPETRRTSSNNSNFLTPSPLVFRLTGRGQASMLLQWTASFGRCLELKWNLNESGKLRGIEEITRPNLGFTKRKGSTKSSLEFSASSLLQGKDEGRRQA